MSSAALLLLASSLFAQGIPERCRERGQEKSERPAQIKACTKAIEAWKPAHGKTLKFALHRTRGESRAILALWPEAQEDF